MNPAHAHAHEMRLLIGGVDLFAAMVEAVDAAQHEVRLETYIFSFEGAGADVAQALMRAAQRGVRVCVLVDGVGTHVPRGPIWGRMSDHLPLLVEFAWDAP